MNDGGKPKAELREWKLEKRTASGELFEVIEGVGQDGPARVTFRREGLAPECEYARGLPLEEPAVREIQTGDAARMGAADRVR